MLTQTNFDSSAARDSWFDGRRAELEKKWDEVIDQLQSRCSHDATSCEASVDQARADRKKALEDLEQERTSVTIAN